MESPASSRKRTGRGWSESGRRLKRSTYSIISRLAPPLDCNGAKARGVISKFARKAKLLYRMFSEKGEPQLTKVTPLLDVMGFRPAIDWLALMDDLRNRLIESAGANCASSSNVMFLCCNT